jgi:hypothetical protein
MLRSMARALANVAGGVGRPRKKWNVERIKKVMATAPSAENETIGRRIRPNHLVMEDK